jgi:hypothetical protein
MNSPLPPLGFLLDCSRTSLKNFWLSNLNRSANTKKHVQELLSEWIEATALAMLCEWMDKHGEELIVLAAAAPSAWRES